jgi:hypothetical protein
MATTPLDINGARSWLDQNLGGGYGANGQFQPGSVFNNGVYDTSNTQRNDQVLGKAQQMGYSPNQISQILGIPASQISAFQSNPQNAPLINSFASSFKTDATNPASYMTQSGVTNPQIQSWLAAHPGASDQTIAQAMNQYGVGTQQMAGALGADPNYIQSRYDAATGASPGPGGMGGNLGMGGSGGVMGTMGGQAGGVAGYPGANPYLDQMAQGITRQVNNNLQRNVLPGIRSDAVAMGGVGSSREGIADGLATGDASKYLADSLGNLYGTDYTNQQNRNLQQYGMDQNFYSAQRGQDLAQIGLGANIYGMGLQNGWNGLNNASNIYNNAAGQTTSGNGSQQQGGGAMGAFGGALGGAQMANNLMNPNNSGSYNLGYGGYKF